ncbi:MAG: MnmC family methyltransferase [Planctomycetota bacterium]
MFPTVLPELAVVRTDDGSNTLLDTKTGDTFHSLAGAFTETRHTYLKNSDLFDRLALGLDTWLLEMGLGSGLALLLSVDLAIHYSTPLHYVALESNWLPADVIDLLEYDNFLENKSLLNDFLDFRNRCDIHTDAADQRFTWQPAPTISVEVHITDARNAFDRLRANADRQFEVIFYDPFSKESNPKLWSSEVFRKIVPLLAPTGRLVTYSCARAVREAIADAGLAPERVPGPPKGKRQSLIVTHPQNPLCRDTSDHSQ